MAPSIRTLDLSGTPTAMGAAHGRAYADEIQHYTNERVELVMSGRWSGGPLARSDVLDIAASMLPAHEAFNAPLHAEMCAMADAAGITPAEGVIVGGFTDFVDTVRAVVGGTTPAEVIEDDCTAFIIPNARAANGQGMFGQTWDMHDTATKHVLLLRVRPADAPAANVFTTTGCLGQIGMNEVGVCVGINNLTGLDGARGVNWTHVVRSMLTAESADDALRVLLDADLAGAHNYLIFDRNGSGYNVEAMPSVRTTTELDDNPIVHTNHTLHAETSEQQAEKDPAMLSSSVARLDTATEMLAEGTIDEERLFEVTREPSAICQKPIDPWHIESSGAAIMRPSTGEFWACWGQPAENDYTLVPLP